MKKHSLYALAAAGLLAGGLSVSSASAADLGGNCCADLEERIASMRAEIARCEKAIADRGSTKAAAEKLFRL